MRRPNEATRSRQRERNEFLLSKLWRRACRQFWARQQSKQSLSMFALRISRLISGRLYWARRWASWLTMVTTELPTDGSSCLWPPDDSLFPVFCALRYADRLLSGRFSVDVRLISSSFCTNNVSNHSSSAPLSGHSSFCSLFLLLTLPTALLLAFPCARSLSALVVHGS